MSIAIDEVRRIREMIRNFLYAVHGYGILEVDLTSVKKQEDKMLVKGSFKIRKEEFAFTVELDSDGRLLSYERGKGVSRET